MIGLTFGAGIARFFQRMLMIGAWSASR